MLTLQHAQRNQDPSCFGYRSRCQCADLQPSDFLPMVLNWRPGSATARLGIDEGLHPCALQRQTPGLWIDGQRRQLWLDELCLVQQLD